MVNLGRPPEIFQIPRRLTDYLLSGPWRVSNAGTSSGVSCGVHVRVEAGVGGLARGASFASDSGVEACSAGSPPFDVDRAGIDILSCVAWLRRVRWVLRSVRAGGYVYSKCPRVRPGTSKVVTREVGGNILATSHRFCRPPASLVVVNPCLLDSSPPRPNSRPDPPKRSS